MYSTHRLPIVEAQVCSQCNRRVFPDGQSSTVADLYEFLSFRLSVTIP
jgi:hypothetical protein